MCTREGGTWCCFFSLLLQPILLFLLHNIKSCFFFSDLCGIEKRIASIWFKKKILRWIQSFSKIIWQFNLTIRPVIQIKKCITYNLIFLFKTVRFKNIANIEKIHNSCFNFCERDVVAEKKKKNSSCFFSLPEKTRMSLPTIKLEITTKFLVLLNIN